MLNQEDSRDLEAELLRLMEEHFTQLADYGRRHFQVQEPPSQYRPYEMHDNIGRTNALWYVDPNFLIERRHGMGGAVRHLFKRMVRKAMFWRERALWGQQSDFNGAVVRTLNQVGEFTLDVQGRFARAEESWNNDIVKSSRQLRIAMAEFARDIGSVRRDFPFWRRDIQQALRDMSLRLDGLNHRMDGLEHRNAASEQLHALQVSQMMGTVQEMQSQIRDLQGQSQALADLNQAVQEQGQALAYLNQAVQDEGQNHIGQARNAPGGSSVDSAIRSPDAFDYLGFENMFRGSIELIRERQRAHLVHLPSSGRAVDLGCGRGEMLTLLLEHGLEAVGVDANPDMIDVCAAQGLPVFQSDILEYLGTLEDRSLAAITICQVVEHLPSWLLFELIETCYRKLHREGVLLIETPNPTSLSIYYGAFYMDFTHIRPVHPLSLEFLCRSKGFSEATVRYMSKIDDVNHVPRLEIAEENTDLFNEGLQRLNERVFGYQDYVLVAKKRVEA